MAFDPKAFLATLTQRPGVYRMLDAEGVVLYVGKARNLRRRVASYFRASGLSAKVLALTRQIERIEVTVTHTEAEALILENHLIKAHRPRYNVLLRDSKSYPYIYLASEQDFPRLGFHRGARKAPGRYFGPFPSAGAVRASLQLMQKVFRVRQCEDSVYANRSRPCLQYQIRRCSGPCVGLVNQQGYAQDVADAVRFLEGRSSELIDDLAQRMEAAAAALEFEQAARLRDQISLLRRVQERQYVSGESGDLDIIAAVVRGGLACVQVFFIRGGHNLGNQAYYPSLPGEARPADLLTAFLPQYYLDQGRARGIPAELLTNVAPRDAGLLAQALGEAAGRRVRILQPQRGERARWLQLAAQNAEGALAVRLASRGGVAARLAALAEVLGLAAPPARIECFDISHTQGEATVAACVVFGAEGPLKSDYRRFNIRDITPGDDYAAMAQAVRRRYARLQRGEAPVPDLLLIDGGQGQIRATLAVLDELGIDGLRVVGVAKGPTRKPGWEILHVVGEGEVELTPDSPALHLIQQVRDEAHRFAITGHRQRRARARSESPLEQIPGVGPKRRRELLRQFGGLSGIARAGVEDLARVPGINRALAGAIYDHFHGA